MPPAWAGQPQWRILETRFDGGLNFLAAWRGWKDDPRRPRILHFVSIASQVDASALPELLARECYGLLPGVHRLVFEQGRVLLTLCLGERDRMLRELEFHADSVIVNDPGTNLKLLARRCRRGTAVVADGDDALVDALTRHGFAIGGRNGGQVRGKFAPAWEPRGRSPAQHRVPGDCIVIGAGLAGAAAAASMARRGWTVRVLDAAPAAAAGASGLPAGLLVPQGSPDDNLLSRLSRDGVRATLQQAQALLQPGSDWEPSGVLEHHIDGAPARAHAGQPEAAVWSRPADQQQKALAGLAADAAADWHEKAAWIRPAALVQAWLAQPGVQLHSGAVVAELVRADGAWQALDPSGALLARGEVLIVAAALTSRELLPGLSLQPVRGQVSWGPHEPGLALPPFPVNGDGSFIPSVPTAEGPVWLCGASFDRGDTTGEPREIDHEANFARLQRLLPAVAQQLEPAFASARLRAWVGTRCASTDRRPLVGPIDEDDPAGAWVSTAMGSRGLTFAALCAELIAARLHGEPLPLARNLARALAANRRKTDFQRKTGPESAPGAFV